MPFHLVKTYSLYEWRLQDYALEECKKSKEFRRKLDCNMNNFLIVWDKLFGTFQKEKDAEPVRFGIVTPLTEEQARHPMTTISLEFEAIWQDATQANLTPMQRLKYIFAAPGWSHDGSKMTSKQCY